MEITEKIKQIIEEISNKKKYGTLKIICNFSQGEINKVSIFDGVDNIKLKKLLTNK